MSKVIQIDADALAEGISRILSKLNVACEVVDVSDYHGDTTAAPAQEAKTQVNEPKKKATPVEAKPVNEAPMPVVPEEDSVDKEPPWMTEGREEPVEKKAVSKKKSSAKKTSDVPQSIVGIKSRKKIIKTLLDENGGEVDVVFDICKGIHAKVPALSKIALEDLRETIELISDFDM